MSDNEEPKDSRRKRRQSDIALFHESGMTDEDRRQLRRNQRKLHHDVDQEIDRGDDEERMDYISRKRSTNNGLFSKVKFTREAALDAENNVLIAKKTLQEVDQMVQVPRFDPNKLAVKLRSKLSTGPDGSKQFNWKNLGKECGVCFNAIPAGVSFLAGTMDQEETIVKRARKARQQRASAEDLEEVRPEQVNTAQNKGDADNLSAVEKALKHQKKVLRKLSQKGGRGTVSEEIDGVKFLFNPKSFTQTVENIFNFSFLIKKSNAEAGIRAPGEGGLYVKHLEKDEDEEVNQEETTQAVVAFTMKDWRLICEGHNLQEGNLKHRTGSKHAPSTSLSQSSR